MMSKEEYPFCPEQHLSIGMLEGRYCMKDFSISTYGFNKQKEWGKA